MPPVSTTLAKLEAKFAAGVIDTSGKFAAGVNDTGGKLAASVNDTGGKYQAAEILIHEKKQEAKNLVTLSPPPLCGMQGQFVPD